MTSPQPADEPSAPHGTADRPVEPGHRARAFAATLLGELTGSGRVRDLGALAPSGTSAAGGSRPVRDGAASAQGTTEEPAARPAPAPAGPDAAARTAGSRPQDREAAVDAPFAGTPGLDARVADRDQAQRVSPTSPPAPGLLTHARPVAAPPGASEPTSQQPVSQPVPQPADQSARSAPKQGAEQPAAQTQQSQPAAQTQQSQPAAQTQQSQPAAQQPRVQEAAAAARTPSPAAVGAAALVAPEPARLVPSGRTAGSPDVRPAPFTYVAVAEHHTAPARATADGALDSAGQRISSRVDRALARRAARITMEAASLLDACDALDTRARAVDATWNGERHSPTEVREFEGAWGAFYDARGALAQLVA